MTGYELVLTGLDLGALGLTKLDGAPGRPSLRTTVRGSGRLAHLATTERENGRRHRQARKVRWLLVKVSGLSTWLF